MQPAPAQSNSVLSVLIVGSGFAGLGLGARLRQAGVHDFEILERGADVGGTWRDNQYPGAACDVESHLYSFSFAQNPGWTRQFAPQREILDYLRGCADRFGLRPHLRLSTEVRGASYDAERGLWEVRCSDGVRHTRALVLGTGGLSRPKDPDIPGLGDFTGPCFHSARWDHAAALRGKTVGVMTIAETLSLYAGGYIGVINELYVVPEYRSEGVGKILLDAARDLADERGWRRLEVTTPGAEYQKTLHFYEKEGFLPIGPRYKFEL